MIDLFLRMIIYLIKIKDNTAKYRISDNLCSLCDNLYYIVD